MIVVSYSNQATRSEESYWGNSLFGDNGNTMKNYFKLMSGSKFWFTPAEETYGTKNNGVVYVKLDENHPNTSGSNSTNIGTTKSNALEAASKYVDFSKFDTNGDKVLSWQELSIVYVIAGRSTKFGMANDGISKYAIGSYKTNYTYTKFLGYIIYDVKVGSISFGDSYAVVGEMQSSRQPLTFGSIAHELCHVIGAKISIHTADIHGAEVPVILPCRAAAPDSARKRSDFRKCSLGNRPVLPHKIRLP